MARKASGGCTGGIPARLGAALLCLCLAAAVTWPLAAAPGAGAHDLTDTLFNTWLMAWNHHALTSLQNPLSPPIFQGQPDAEGRNDLLLTQTLAAMPLRAAGASPLEAHNLILVISLALAGFSVFLLAESCGIGTAGSLFSAGAFVCLPFFQSHLWHVQLFSCSIAILAVRQFLTASDGRARSWPVAPLILLQCAASLYYLVFLDIALLLLLPRAVRGRRPGPVLWALLGNAACLPLLAGHAANAAAWPVDTMASMDLATLVAPWENSRLLSWMRSPHATVETALWPGLAVAAGAALHVFGRRRGNERLTGGWSFLAMWAVFLAIAVGPTLAILGRQLSPAPWRLVAGLPVLSSIRLPARGAFLMLLPMVLAAGRAWDRRPAMALGGILLCLAEVWPGRMPLQTPELPRYHSWLAARRFSLVAVLPVGTDLSRPESECANLYGSTAHFTPMVNGYSTSLPEGYPRTAAILDTWPSPAADSIIAAMGIECLICRGFVPADADPVWTDGPRPVAAVVLGPPGTAGVRGRSPEGGQP